MTLDGESMSQKSRSRWIVVGALAVLALSTVWFASQFTWSESAKAANRDAIQKIYSVVMPGQSRQAVEAAIKPLLPERFRFGRDDANGRWIIEGPWELFATHWVLTIRFEKDVVASVEVRTSDGPAPAGGPPDKTA